MWLRAGDVHHVHSLDEDDQEVLVEVLMTLEVCQREAGRKDHVDKDKVEASCAEHGIVEEATELICVDSLVQSLPFLLNSWLHQSRLVFDHEYHHKDWENNESNDDKYLH